MKWKKEADMDNERNIYRALRLIRGFDVQELANKLNTTDDEILSVEKGLSQPVGAQLFSYAEALGVTSRFIESHMADAENRDEKFEDYLFGVLQDMRRLSMEYDVQVKLPYTHTDRPEQYAVYFREVTDPRNTSFVCYADCIEDVNAYISGARNDSGVPYRVVSAKWNTVLQSLRCKKGLTCKQLEDMTGISRRQLEYLEGACGRVNKTSLERAVKLSKALGCCAEDLMDKNEDS